MRQGCLQREKAQQTRAHKKGYSDDHHHQPKRTEKNEDMPEILAAEL